MIEFKPIEIQDRAKIESYTHQSECRNCDMAFANIYCWREFHKSCWAEVDGFLVIRFLIDGKEQVGYMQPIGEGNFFHILDQLEEDARINFSQRLRLYGLCREGRGTITGSGKREFAFDDDRSLSDYIYLAEELRTLPGRKLQPKRNHLNRFTSKYNYRFEAMEPRHFEECLALDEQWRRERTTDADTESMRFEQKALREAFDNFESLGIKGGVLYVDDRLVAFTYGSAINYDTFDCHIEKADTSYEGVFATINKLFAEHLGEEFRYINREEDMGLEGLRRSKLSYYPTFLWPKTSAIKLNHKELELKELWQEAFGDDDEFVDSFIMRHYQAQNMLSISDSEGLLSMLHLLPFESQTGKVGYIYGVATKQDQRGKGLCSELMRQAIDEGRKRGFDALMLIPAGDGLNDFYARFGFGGEIVVEFRCSDGFDFGTGNKEQDRAMILPLKEGVALPDERLILSK